MPRESAFEEVDEDESDAFEVVAATLFDPDVGVDGGVTGGAGQALVVSVRNVFLGLRISKSLRKAKVYQVDHVGLLA